MFLGTYSPRMDAKGRIILPAKFREELSAGLVLTRGQERCLYVFPSAESSASTSGCAAHPCRGEPPATSCEYSSREPRMSYLINRDASPSLRFFGSTPGLATSSWSSGPEPRGNLGRLRLGGVPGSHGGRVCGPGRRPLQPPALTTRRLVESAETRSRQERRFDRNAEPAGR